MVNLGAGNFGKLNLKRIHISNVNLMEANIETGAFNSSKDLKEIVIEQSANRGKGTISSHAFSGLNNLRTIKLGNFVSVFREYFYKNIFLRKQFRLHRIICL